MMNSISPSSSNTLTSAYLFPFSLFTILLLFAAYSFMNASNNANGDLLALLFLIIVLPKIMSERELPSFPVYFFWGFLVIGLSSILFAPSQYTDPVWFIRAVSRLFVVYFVFLGFERANEPIRNFLRISLPGLSFLMAVLVLLNTSGFPVKENLQGVTPLPIVNFEWNDKYSSFCILFLTWSSVALLWKRSILASYLAVSLLMLSVIALFRTGSESAQVALILSLLVFCATHVRNKGIYLISSAGPLIMTLFIPVLWVAVAPLKSYFPQSGLFQEYAIDVRLHLFDFCANMIRKELVLGFGFGSTLHLPIPDDTVPGWSIFPGGHPHNFVFLFFVEHGVLGYLFLVLAMALLFRTIYRATEGRENAPAIWALFTAGLVIFSLSFAIWQADIVLMYGMFFSLLFMNISAEPSPDRKTDILLKRGLFMYGVVCVLFYSVDYFFLHG